MISRRFIAFVVVGGGAASLNWGSRFVFDLAMSFDLAIVLAFMVGLTSAFVLNRLFVFETSSLPVRQQFTRFTVVNLAALLQVWCISVGLAWLLSQAGVSETVAKAIAHGVGVASPVCTSYLLHKHWTFARDKAFAPPRESR